MAVRNQRRDDIKINGVEYQTQSVKWSRTHHHFTINDVEPIVRSAVGQSLSPAELSYVAQNLGVVLKGVDFPEIISVTDVEVDLFPFEEVPQDEGEYHIEGGGSSVTGMTLKHTDKQEQYHHYIFAKESNGDLYAHEVRDWIETQEWSYNSLCECFDCHETWEPEFLESIKGEGLECPACGSEETKGLGEGISIE